MTDREKLIDLIVEGNIRAFGRSESFAEIIADHLIANGVRLESSLEKKQATSEESERWIPVTERLPVEEWKRYRAEKEWDVFPCIAVVKHRNSSQYVDKLFYTGENFVDEEYVRYTAQVTHWMPLPEPPKGDEG